MRVERGRLWEDRAAQYLERQGVRVVARGYRCRLGELDLVCRDEGHLIVVEVSARSSNNVCSAIESIGPRKRHRIVQATRHLLMRHSEWHGLSIRFDVIAIDGIDTEAAQIHWVQNAFDGG
jgi:putative endonuclease